MFNKRGQVGTEYLIVIAFVMFLVIALIGIGLFYSNQISDTIKMNQVQNFANKVISSAESVFSEGEPSKVTIEAYLPSGVEDIEVLINEIVFSVQTGTGVNIISFGSDVPLEGTISINSGVKVMEITAQNDKVTLSD